MHPENASGVETMEMPVFRRMDTEDLLNGLVPPPLQAAVTRSSARKSRESHNGFIDGEDLADRRMSHPVSGTVDLDGDRGSLVENELHRRRSLSTLDAIRQRRRSNLDQGLHDFESGRLEEDEVDRSGPLRVVNAEVSPEPPRKNSIELAEPPLEMQSNIPRKQPQQHTQMRPATGYSQDIRKLKKEQKSGTVGHGDGKRRSRLSVFGVSLAARRLPVHRILTVISHYFTDPAIIAEPLNLQKRLEDRSKFAFHLHGESSPTLSTHIGCQHRKRQRQYCRRKHLGQSQQTTRFSLPKLRLSRTT
jgi:hypothetical protein